MRSAAADETATAYESDANVRSAAADESVAAYESDANVRSAAADESVAAYESECEPGGLYGALKIGPEGSTERSR